MGYVPLFWTQYSFYHLLPIRANSDNTTHAHQNIAAAYQWQRGRYVQGLGAHGRNFSENAVGSCLC